MNARISNTAVRMTLFTVFENAMKFEPYSGAPDSASRPSGAEITGLGAIAQPFAAPRTNTSLYNYALTITSNHDSNTSA